MFLDNVRSVSELVLVSDLSESTGKRSCFEVSQLILVVKYSGWLAVVAILMVKFDNACNLIWLRWIICNILILIN